MSCLVLSWSVLACLGLSWLLYIVLSWASRSTKIIVFPKEKRSFSTKKKPSEIDIDFQEVFGGILAPFWEVKSTKIMQKVGPQRHQSSDRLLGRYLVDLGSDFGHQDEPKTGSRGRQDREDRPKRAPRRPKRPPRRAQEGPKKREAFHINRFWPPGSSKDPLWTALERFLLRFRSQLAFILIPKIHKNPSKSRSAMASKDPPGSIFD